MLYPLSYEGGAGAKSGRSLLQIAPNFGSMVGGGPG